jgi:hypothetical protein
VRRSGSSEIPSPGEPDQRRGEARSLDVARGHHRIAWGVSTASGEPVLFEMIKQQAIRPKVSPNVARKLRQLQLFSPWYRRTITRSTTR